LFICVGYMRYSSQFTTAALIVGGAFFKVQTILISGLPVIMAFLMFGELVGLDYSAPCSFVKFFDVDI
jgi:hypothetical protein